MERLPPELVVYLLSFVPLQDIVNVMVVCKEWKGLVEGSEPFWTDVYRRRFNRHPRLAANSFDFLTSLCPSAKPMETLPVKSNLKAPKKGKETLDNDQDSLEHEALEFSMRAALKRRVLAERNWFHSDSNCVKNYILHAHENSVNAVKFFPDLAIPTLITCSDDSTIKIWQHKDIERDEKRVMKNNL
jgi:WD40 repeat protein